MATEARSSHELLSQLGSPQWSVALAGVAVAEAWLKEASVGSPDIEPVVEQLVALAAHKKWEIRRAVANTAAVLLHPAFDKALRRLATDENSRVRQAAQLAVLRRRDWQNASTLGRQHEDRINATLDDIETRFGVRGREAVKRASEQIANTFARELYHEMISLLTPLALAADAVKTKLTDDRVSRAELLAQAHKVDELVGHVRAVLDAMRAYTAIPKLVFTREPIRKIVEDAAALARGARSGAGGVLPAIELHIEDSIAAEVARSRLVDALKNILANALDAYDGLSGRAPITVSAKLRDGAVLIVVEDAGCGMDEENLRDALVLFATNKPNGTGFGLPLAQKIIQTEHGGSLKLSSVPRQGTAVEVLIPCERQEAPQ